MDSLTEVISGEIPITLTVPVDPQIEVLTIQSDFQRLFATRDFSRMSVPQFLVRI